MRRGVGASMAWRVRQAEGALDAAPHLSAKQGSALEAPVSAAAASARGSSFKIYILFVGQRIARTGSVARRAGSYRSCVGYFAIVCNYGTRRCDVSGLTRWLARCLAHQFPARSWQLAPVEATRRSIWECTETRLPPRNDLRWAHRQPPPRASARGPTTSELCWNSNLPLAEPRPPLRRPARVVVVDAPLLHGRVPLQ